MGLTRSPSRAYAGVAWVSKGRGASVKTLVSSRMANWRWGDALVGRKPRTSRREDLITALLSAWLVIGLFIDGWAHNNL
ncbi:MAG TPA: hypothetical protein VGZ50_06030, partial [Actinomycetota bacterium]|nr:hypothetical protein [Actinomycetota bacterium]